MVNNFFMSLIAGVDTLEIGYCVSEYTITQEVWDTLMEAKESAQTTLYDKGTGVNFQGYEFMVLRTGSGRYKLILTNEDLDVRIFMDARSGKHFPELKIRFKSPFLWRHGWQDAVWKVDEWIRTWAIVTEVKVSRIDVTVDMIGDLPVFSPELREVVTRTRKKREFGTYERYSDGRNPNGYRFGANELICRIYDKTQEIRISKKRWFTHLWRKGGWIEDFNVIRIEFQCRRKVIRQFGISTINDLMEKVPDLWKYLTNEWLTVRVIQSDSRRTRWPITEFWNEVQKSLELFGHCIGISRIKQLRSKRETLEGHLRGYILNYIALAQKSLEHADDRYGIRYLEIFVGKLIESPEFESEIKKRMHKYDSMEY